MTRVERYHYAIDILNKRNNEFFANRKRNLYDFKVDENDLTITIHGIIFFSEIKNMDYLYIQAMKNYETKIQF